MTRVRRALSIVVIVTLFLVTLLLNWPVGPLLAALSNRLPSEVSIAPAHGTLLSGSITELRIVPSQGWPIGLGPLRWEWTSPASIRMTLGDRQSWQLTGKWRGIDSHWRLTGGSLEAFALQQWPASLAGNWQGELVADFEGASCKAAQGSLVSRDIRLVTPAPLALGRGRLTLDCDGGAVPRLDFKIEDNPKLDMTATFELRPSDVRGELHGHLDANHPLADWWRLVDRQANFPDLHRTFAR
ncbi:hypothetical protein [Salinicola aestuarinus]|uniref:hypothetical protein n=1 Tax=Salinicola aestuarinus TaxID=1949082 RepID=UPI000DA18795|nr:hypothetical protein [Salinicola aestuarinus]